MATKSQLKKLKQAAAAGKLDKPVEEDMGMPNMPIMPDSNLKYFWTGDPNSGQFEYSKCIQIYPTYINSDKKIPEGRRISKEYCCSDPNVGELSEVCQALKLKHVLEPYKMYPRDFYASGRLRVQITGENGELVNPEITSKKALLMKMGTLIPQLKSRIKRLTEEREREKERELEREREKSLEQAVTSGGGGGKKKKGKKGPK
mmetsp:Transcript_28514/g.28840  ORF Transcript_28514/g.28840 Transcript_28514/m.28840 type:complete len:203 (+) Transcript_28514:114-722(+)|eukprot:CAMPEP_0182427366 /NCGR_PEP_ID=MMETSP1167-20130531/17092_1 /TAXON_ID=2988 /ORGANISM="Mallomonas Sp, Strain CCMP3275" /LENGTH=202 /DNA_ID=CAMNT_0024609553 /DNA_START=22 /DNA_END=630 /DNA_ORIENTATION=-